MKSPRTSVGLTTLLIGSAFLAACGGGAAPASSAAPAASAAASKPAAASGAASTKPASSGEASAKPASSGEASAKPAASTAAPAKPGAGIANPKVALLTTGPVNDAGWNQQAYEALQAAKKDLNVQVANTEDVKDADQLPLMRNYANQGFNVIIGHGFEYQKAIEQAAKEFPNIQFIQIGGIGANGSNLQSFLFTTGQGGWVAGALAAATTKNNHIGVVGAVDIPSIHGDFDAFAASVKQYNPQAKVDTPIYSGSFDDLAKGKAAGTSAIATGADVILANGDNVNPGTVQAAKGKPVRIIGWNRDQTYLDPAIVEGSWLQRVDKVLESMIKDIEAGKQSGKNQLGGAKEGFGEFVFNDQLVPAEIQAKVKAVQADVIAGKITLPELKS